VYLELVVRRPGALGRLGQINAGFSSRGLVFGYQRDYIDGTVGHTYRLGFGSSAGGLAAGAVVAFYRGDASASAWDVGIRYTPSRHLVLGTVVTNLGEPDVRGVTLPITFVPGATLAPLGDALQGSAHAYLTTREVRGYAFGVTLRVAALAALVRLDTDRDLRRASIAVGVTLGARDRVGSVVTMSGDGREIDAASLHAVASRRLTR
jgi:hypothetical protein